MPEISLVDTRKIIDAIKDKYGVDLGCYSPSSLGNKLDRILKINLHPDADSFITDIHSDESFFEKFIFDLLHIQSEFFRDPEFWINLLNYDLSLRIKPFSKFKVLIPACTNNTELISLLIFLKESGLGKKTEVYVSQLSKYPRAEIFKPEISLKDIDRDNINKVFPKLEASKYYSYTSDEIKFNTDLFSKVSIIDQDFDFKLIKQKFNFILFRNVLLNYTQVHQNRIIKNLVSGMVRGGLIAFGYRENISSFLQASDEIYPLIPQENIYIKK